MTYNKAGTLFKTGHRTFASSMNASLVTRDHQEAMKTRPLHSELPPLSSTPVKRAPQKLPDYEVSGKRLELNLR